MQSATATGAQNAAPFIGKFCPTTEEVMRKQREQGSAERYFHAGRHMFYGNIKLVPVAADWYPYDQPMYADKWHVPGRREFMSTDALVTMATERGVTVTITEYKGVSTQTTRLN